MKSEQQKLSDKSTLISKLRADFKFRAAYIMAKVGTLVPSQIRGLRLKSETPRQPDLAKAAGMHQSRISALETAGNNPTISTLSEVAAALNVGLKIEFVPFSEMLAWENGFSQDDFKVKKLEEDQAFLHPHAVTPQPMLGTATIAHFTSAWFYRPTERIQPKNEPWTWFAKKDEGLQETEFDKYRVQFQDTSLPYFINPSPQGFTTFKGAIQ